MDLLLLENVLDDLGEPKYRARQLWEWTARGAGSYDAMTTLSKPLRATLAEAVPFSTLELVTEHAVYMGMGEPFLNFDAVLASARRLPDLGITHRSTTISTVGWMPGLRRFVDEVEEPIRLALSLHAADPGRRSKLMPVNDRYPLGARPVPPLLRVAPSESLRRVRAPGRRERLTRGRAAPRRGARPGDLQGQPDPVQPDRRLRRLRSTRDRGVQGRARPRPVPATVRLTRRRDIEAACGQLAASREPLRR